ncbi:uncharacterized protein LOC135461731 [Liolophura sinensis]|uniref:uncharacterized protein LOC135461731 n=1 Tax=Liolophura sinensis TaxID=3198878 RepID=UPI003159418D
MKNCPSECAGDDLISGDNRVASPETESTNAIIIGPVIAGVFILVVVVVLLCLFVKRRRYRKQQAAQGIPVSEEVNAVQTQGGSRAVTYADIMFQSDESDVTNDVLSVQYASVHKPRKQVPVLPEVSCLQTYDHIPERSSTFTTSPDAHYNTLQDSGLTEAAKEEEPKPTAETEYDRLNRLLPGNNVDVNKPPDDAEYDTLNRDLHPDGHMDVQTDRVTLAPYFDDTGSGYEYAQVIPNR